MDQQTEIMIRCEPALRWLEDNPAGTARMAAKRFNCPAEMLEAWIRRHGMPAPGVVDQVKAASGVLTVTRIPKGHIEFKPEPKPEPEFKQQPKPEPAPETAAQPKPKTDPLPMKTEKPYLSLPRKPFGKTIDNWRENLEAFAKGKPAPNSTPGWKFQLKRWFGEYTSEPAAVKEFLAWVGDSSAEPAKEAAGSARRPRANRPARIDASIEPQEIPAIVKLVVDIEVRVRCSTV